jgi:nucleotidyltransferase-like protein
VDTVAQIPRRVRPGEADRLLAELGKPRLEKIVSVAAQVSFPDESIILGGSIGLGLGNYRSDIDVVLLSPASPPRPAGPFQIFADGERIEVVRASLFELRSMVTYLADALASAQPIRLSHADLRLLSRAAYGCRAGGAPLNPKVEEELVQICHLTAIRRSTEAARQHALVAALALEQADGLIAAWNLRGALEAVLQEEMLRSGAPYAGSKWLPEQLAASGHGTRLLPLLDLPADGSEQAFVTACLTEVERVLRTPTTVRALGHHARWSISGLDEYCLGQRNVLVQREHNAVTELTPDDHAAWNELSATASSQPIGTEPRPARDLAWRLYVRGLTLIRWTRGCG